MAFTVLPSGPFSNNVGLVAVKEASNLAIRDAVTSYFGRIISNLKPVRREALLSKAIN